MSVTANITISFGEQDAAGANAHLSAEVDGRDTGYNAGKTSFAPGDIATFLVYKSANVAYDTPVPSAGSIRNKAIGVVVTKEDDIQFPDTDTASLSIPSTGIVAVTWLGRSLGGLTLVSPTEIKASAKGVAVARVRYTCVADAWELASPATLAGLTDFAILVFILGRILGEES